MKTRVIILSAILFLLSVYSKAQETENKNYIWSYEGKKKINTIGTYIGLSGSYSPLNNTDSYWLGGRIGIVFNQKWTIGVGGNALDYDRQLSELVDDGTYRLQAGYAGLFVERLFPLKDWGKLGVSWLGGSGITFFEYDNEYTGSKEWYEEIVDMDDFAINELGVEFQVRVYKNWWMGAHASYRLTSPVEMKGEDEYFLRDYSAGVSVKWGIF